MITRARKLSAVAPVLFALSLGALAAEPPPPAPLNPLPPAVRPPEAKPAAEPPAAKFYTFVGNWKGKGELRRAGKPAVTLNVTWRCKKEAAGWALYCDHNARGEQTHISGSDLFGVDPATGQGHWYAITNQGSTRDQLVQWTDARTMKARHAWNQGGKAMEEIVTIIVPDDKALEFRSVTTENGKEVASFSGRLERGGQFRGDKNTRRRDAERPR